MASITVRGVPDETRDELAARAARSGRSLQEFLRIDLVPYRVVAERVWALRGNVAAYDAWYVAVAEALDAPLCTLDRRLSRAPGPSCTFQVPPA